MSAKTINEVIQNLDHMIDRALREQSPRGFFAALYKMVTIRIKEGIARGEFEDGARMEKLTLLLANRYLDAYGEWMQGAKPTAAWRLAFEATEQWTPVTMQHLLLGLNAHINLDLGIAAAKATSKAKQPALKNDFDQINAILGELTGRVQEELERIWPPLALANLLPFVDAFLNFSLQHASDGAWAFAQALADTPKEDWEGLIRHRDHRVARLGQELHKPSPLVRAAMLPVRLGEPNTDVVIRILDGLEPALVGSLRPAPLVAV